MSNAEQIQWSRMSLEELETFWDTHIEPDLARDGLDLSTRPTYEEITDAGYSGIAYALREHHDLTVAQFLSMVGYPQSGDDDSYPWGIGDETPLRELSLYVDTRLARKGLAEGTITAKRSRLARFVRTYRDLFGRADIVSRIREDSDAVLERDERQRVRDVFERFNADLSSPESRQKHLLDVREFYAWLERDRDAVCNPATDAPQRYRWKNKLPDKEDRDPPALDAGDVRQLVDACKTESDRLLIVATCAWGLRRGEVAALSQRQFDLEGDDPKIVFEVRKNGPGSVSVIYGLETLESRIATLVEQEDWNGYLFPSVTAEAGHVIPDTITERFKRIADRAGLEIRGETPTPQYGRRYWYRTYSDAVERLSSHVQAIADDQGSADARVVVQNYLGEEESRRQRQAFMREELAMAFGGDT